MDYLNLEHPVMGKPIIIYTAIADKALICEFKGNQWTIYYPYKQFWSMDNNKLLYNILDKPQLIKYGWGLYLTLDNIVYISQLLLSEREDSICVCSSQDLFNFGCKSAKEQRCNSKC